ncbi:hypothetical protein [Candidatus Sororendozoicomonas aggregata]
MKNITKELEAVSLKEEEITESKETIKDYSETQNMKPMNILSFEE